MQNGAIRVNRVNQDNFHDLSDYWLLTMHDNFNGQITRMCFNYNNKYFFRYKYYSVIMFNHSVRVI